MSTQEGSTTQRCAKHQLVYDAKKVHSGCVLCRAEPTSRPATRSRWPLLAAISIAVLAGGALALVRSRSAVTPAAPASAPRSETRVLSSRNAAGRSGIAFLPHQLSDGPRPLLVLFHGTGGSGSAILEAFKGIAEQRGILLVAPDSGRSPDGAWNWQVADAPGELTDDRRHATKCIDEVLALPGVRVDMTRVLAAGHSGGASSAPYLASHDSRFSAFAVLHGGVFPGGLGSNRIRGWFSTGDSDTLRTPESVRNAASSSAGVTGPLTLRTFAGGHELSPPEVQGLIDWWLGS